MKELLKQLYKSLHKLLEIQESLDLIIKDENTMALAQSVQDVLKAVDDASNAIAARIQELLGQVAAAGELTPEAKAAFQVEIDKLNALGKSAPTV